MRLLSMKVVCERTTLSRAEIKRKVAAGKFPQFHALGDRKLNKKGRLTGRIAWLESDVVSWIVDRTKKRDSE